MTYGPGDMARSLAGHDAGRLYVIIGRKGGMPVLADGRLRKAGSPKCKNFKHVQLIHTGEHALKEALRNGETVTDEQIRRFIKTFGGN